MNYQDWSNKTLFNIIEIKQETLEGELEEQENELTKTFDYESSFENNGWGRFKKIS